MDFKAIKYDNKYGEAVVIRPYVPQQDAAAALRLFNEAGWIERGKEPKALDDFFAAGLALVGEVDGSVECITSSANGDMRYLDEELPLEGVTCVITGLPARRKGLARRMTAELMMHNAAKGAAVSVLGVFDLGFYDRLGYGTAIYEHHAACDLSDLRPGPARTPVRRGTADRALRERRRCRRRRAPTRGSSGSNSAPGAPSSRRAVPAIRKSAGLSPAVPPRPHPGHRARRRSSAGCPHPSGERPPSAGYRASHRR